MESPIDNPTIHQNGVSCQQQLVQLIKEKQLAEQEISALRSVINANQHANSMQVECAFERINHIERLLNDRDAEIAHLKDLINDLTNKNIQLSNQHANSTQVDCAFERINLLEQLLNHKIDDLIDKNIQLNHMCVQLSSDRHLTIIGQFVYEFCELISRYVIGQSIDSIENLVEKEAHKLNWSTIKHYVQKYEFSSMPGRLLEIETILKEENIDKCIDSYLLQLRKFRHTVYHPNVFKNTQESVLSMIAEHPDIEDNQKNMLSSIVNVVYKIRSKTKL